MRLTRSFIAAVMAASLLLGVVPAHVLGAPKVQQPGTSLLGLKPVKAIPKAPPGTTDVQIWPFAEQGSSRNVVVVEVSMPASVTLPAVIRIPIPPGAAVEWAGEILGGDPAKDPKRAFKTVPGAGGKVAEFVMRESHKGQLETVGAPVIEKNGVFRMKTAWAQSAASVETVFGVRLPAGSSNVSITPTPIGPAAKNKQGEMLYSLAPQHFKAGEITTVAASWTLAPATTGTPQQGSSSPNLLPFVIAFVVGVGIVLLIVIAVRRRRRADYVAGPPGGSSDDANS